MTLQGPQIANMAPDSGLPNVDSFHSLVALDTNNRKAQDVLGFPSWIYKAMNGKTGQVHALRRLEGES